MILVNGNSWTGGPTYENLDDMWPYQMAKKHDLVVTNLAWRGASNQKIFRTTKLPMADAMSLRGCYHSITPWMRI
jgi:hypothetical protein